MYWKLSFLALGAAVAASGQGLESWHATDFSLFQTGALGIGLHTQVRRTPGMNAWAYARLGPVATFHARPWMRWTAAYYYHDVRRSPAHWEGSGRVFGGPELRWTDRRVQVWTRHFVERYWYPAGVRDYRHRHRVQVGWGGRWEPRLLLEEVLDRHGHYLTRPSASFRAFATAHTDLTVGYLYDFRRASGGGPRQAILTTLKVRLGGER